jgi:putative hydrolase of the HAD superfamily
MKTEFDHILTKHLHRLEPIETGQKTRLSKHKPYKLVVFDIYGTLLISGTGDVGSTGENNGLTAFKETMSAVFHVSVAHTEDPIRSEIETIHQKMKHSGVNYPEVDIQQIWESVLEREGLTFTEKQRDEAILEFECRLNPVWPMPGFLELMKDIEQKDVGFETGIVSNAQFYTPLIMEYFLNKPLSSSVFNSEICTFSYTLGEAKPSEKMFERVRRFSEKHEIAPDEVLYVGNDMLKDVYTASLNGFDTVLFAGDQRSLRLREEDERCEKIYPTHIASQLDELRSILF